MARQQPMPLDRAGHVPAARRVGRETKETAIIFGVADHRHCRVARSIDHCRHQQPPDSPALHCRIDRDGPDQHQRRAADFDGPALQCAHQCRAVEGGKTERWDSDHAGANAVRCAAVPVRAEGSIEQDFDGIGIGV